MAGLVALFVLGVDVDVLYVTSFMGLLLVTEPQGGWRGLA